ncbi:MAG: SMI1/KNR4 family protein [Proteobacteria bacterium]|jgi:hypothetical protein|nr:SMI1/KNR4 family protein [Pseudomonadota bacterium]
MEIIWRIFGAAKNPDGERLRAIRRGLDEQGVSLGPPLSEAEIRLFEKQNRLSLPSEYRAFLLAVGNGSEKGPPFYGLLKLDQVPKDKLVQPFPLEKACIWEAGEELPSGVEREHLERGWIDLGTDGCGFHWMLVVSGPQRGKVWNRCGEGIMPWYDKGFFEWMEHWIGRGDDSWIVRDGRE